MNPFARMLSQATESGDFDGPLNGIPYAEFLGLHIRRDGGRLITYLPFDRKLVGSPAPPRLHGGVTAATLEFAAIIQLFWESGADAQALDNLPKPIGGTVEYMRAGRPETLFASAEIARLGRRIANVRTEAWQGDDPDKPIAAALLRFLMPGAG